MTLTSVKILITLSNVRKSCIVIMLLVRKFDRYFMISIKMIFNTRPSFLHHLVWSRCDNVHLLYGASAHMPSNLLWLWRTHIKSFCNFFSRKLSSWEFWYMLQGLFITFDFYSLMRSKVLHGHSFLIYLLAKKDRID